MRIMALDLGSRTIGVALSDNSGTIAQPFCVIDREDGGGLEAIRDIVDEKAVEKILLGFPVNMDGSVGESAKRSQAFAERLRREIGVKVILWDERLTTVSAERSLLEADLSRKKRKRLIDKVAAGLILQSYLDSGGGGDE